jgi:sporulation protein YlmC with PRC-barrel domain
MLTEISELIGMEVYTDKAIALGNIDDLVIETDTQKVEGLFVNNPNPLLVEHSRAVSVPYRWIHSVGDVIILKYFPKFVRTEASPERVPKIRKLKEDVVHAVHSAEEKIVHAEKAAVAKFKDGGHKLTDDIKEL